MRSGSPAGHAAPQDGPYTVARALTDYLDNYKPRGGKGAETVESVVRRNVLPELGGLLVRSSHRAGFSIGSESPIPPL
jgi:hypothetical protein